MEKLLIVDDDSLLLESLVKVLSSEELYEIDYTTNGLEVLDKLQSNKYDLILLDYHMEPINGVELLKRIRQKGYKGPAIMMTGFGTFEIATEVSANDIYTIIPKPIETKSLRSTIKKALQPIPIEPGKTSEPKQLELEEINRRLNASRRQFQAVFDGIADPVLILDVNLKVIGANKASMEKLNLDRSEILEKYCYDLFCGGDISTCDDCPSHRALTTTLKTQGKMYDPLNKNFYQVIAYPIFEEESNDVKGIVEFRRDITKTAEMEARIMRAEKVSSKINLAAEVGHELNNMISIISSHSELTEIYLKENNITKAKESLSAMNAGIGKIISYTKKLMNSNLEEKNVVDIKLITFLNSLLSFISPQPIFSSVKFNQYWENREITIQIDEIHLQQILVNILKNAAEAMKEGTISISVNQINEDRKVQIKISDNGPGMPAEVINQIFSEQISTKETGHGYGLIIVKKLVEQNNGTINVVSRLNQGTEFVLTFPVAMAN
jgi:signal transduction histidine kinase/FixJ family two-component response regulator